MNIFFLPNLHVLWYVEFISMNIYTYILHLVKHYRTFRTIFGFGYI